MTLFIMVYARWLSVASIWRTGRIFSLCWRHLVDDEKTELGSAKKKT